MIWPSVDIFGDRAITIQSRMHRKKPEVKNMTNKSLRVGLLALLLALPTTSPTLGQTAKSQQLKVAV
jgi:hypothetical protein